MKVLSRNKYDSKWKPMNSEGILTRSFDSEAFSAKSTKEMFLTELGLELS